MISNPPKVLAVLGPTASGKSALAVTLARRFNGEIISADSRQVYKGLNIGTGKITKKEMLGVPHHLLDVASPKRRFSVIEYQNLARQKIGEVLSKGRLPILVGGTGFYIEAVVDGIILPDVPPNKQLRAKLKIKPVKTLLEMLAKLDPVRATTIDQKNPRRIIRAIEIATILGAVPPITKSSPYNTLPIGLTLPPEELQKRIATRLHARLKMGMIAEAKNLHINGLSWKRMNELGLEYRYLAFHLQGKITGGEMVTKLQTEIWRYAKRQMTWFKRDKRIKWFKPTEKVKIQKEMHRFLSK